MVPDLIYSARQTQHEMQIVSALSIGLLAIFLTNYNPFPQIHIQLSLIIFLTAGVVLIGYCLSWYVSRIRYVDQPCHAVRISKFPFTVDTYGSFQVVGSHLIFVNQGGQEVKVFESVDDCLRLKIQLKGDLFNQYNRVVIVTTFHHFYMTIETWNELYLELARNTTIKIDSRFHRDLEKNQSDSWLYLKMILVPLLPTLVSAALNVILGRPFLYGFTTFGAILTIISFLSWLQITYKVFGALNRADKAVQTESEVIEESIQALIHSKEHRLAKGVYGFQLFKESHL